MLPRQARLTTSQDFASALRGGRRAGRSLVVVHCRLPEPTPRTARTVPASVGFVTSKAVGNAVTRNQVRRRLRHVMTSRLGALPAGSLTVVRALPAAAHASSAALAADLDAALARLVVSHDRP